MENTNISNNINLSENKDNSKLSDEMPFLKDFNISGINLDSNKDILIKAQHYEIIKQCNGKNIKEASRFSGIPFATLWDELRILEFARLIKLIDSFENGRSVKIIQTLKSGGENGK